MRRGKSCMRSKHTQPVPAGMHPAVSTAEHSLTHRSSQAASSAAWLGIYTSHSCRRLDHRPCCARRSAAEAATRQFLGAVAQMLSQSRPAVWESSSRRVRDLLSSEKQLKGEDFISVSTRAGGHWAWCCSPADRPAG